MIQFPCSGCGKALKVKDDAGGKQAKCPGCGQSMRVPEAVASRSPRPGPLAGVEDRALPLEETTGFGHSHLAPAEAKTLPPLNTPAPVDHPHAGTLRSDDPAEAANLADFLAPSQAPDEIGRLGPYRVLEVLGAGGMGVVFKAEDPQLQRLVALKAMLPTLAASASARQRFLREARAAAAIKHDHIVAIYQVGEDRGAPFLAMEFLEGEPLDARLKRTPPLSLAETLRIGRETAAGLAAAHEHGLIHRDIKPANLWLENQRVRSASKGQLTYRVKILDFGLARAGSDQAQLTQQGAIVGTPAYMAPEQATGEAVDARSDLFSLGCVLYRLTTGELPFKGSDTIATLMAVATQHPRPPRELRPETPTDLSNLVMRLLAKKPEERPASAQAVVEALAAIESDRTDGALRPVRAKPAGALPWALISVAAGLLLMVSLVIGAGALWWLSEQAPATRPSNTSLTKTGPTESTGKKPPPPPPPPPTPGVPLSPLALVSRPPAIPGAKGWTIEPHAHRGPVSIVAHSKDGKRLASGGDDGTVRLWDPQSGQLRSILLGHASKINRLAWSPNGQVLASGGEDATVRLWEADSGELLHTLTRHTGPIRALAWSPDGKTLATGSDDRSVQLWNTATGEFLRVFDRHKNPILGISWQSDRTILSTSVLKGAVKILWLWDAGTGQAIHSHEARGNPAWVADRKVVVYKTGQNTLNFWDVAANKSRPLTLTEHQEPIQSFDISPDGTLLATGGVGRIQWWDAATGKLLQTAPWTNDYPSRVFFSPDGKTLASCGPYNYTRVFIWQAVPANAKPVKPLRHIDGIRTHWLTWSLDGKTVIWGNEETVAFGDAASGKPLHTLPVHWAGTEAAWSPDGKSLAIANWYNHRVHIWDAQTGKFLRFVGNSVFGSLDWSPDGNSIAVVAGYSTTLWHAQTGERGRNLDGHWKGVSAVAWSPDSKKLATSGAYEDNAVRLWDASTGKGIPLPAPVVRDHALAFSPDSRVLARGGPGVTLWDAVTGQAVPLKLDGAMGRADAVAWSRDGKTLAAAYANGTIRLWKAGTVERLKEFKGHEGTVHALAWLEDNQTLVSLGEQDRTVRFWRTDLDAPPRITRGLPGRGRFSPDGKYLVSRHDPTRMEIWETETGRLCGALLPLSGQPRQHLAVSADGHYRITAEAWRRLVYVVQTDNSQEILSPDEFEKKYRWKNDPDKVRLISP